MKWFWRSALALILLLVLMAGVITWLGSREESLRWLLQRVVEDTALKLELNGLQGSLWQGIQVEHLRLEHPEWRLDLHQVGMRWFYWPPDKVQIARLRVAKLQFEQLKSSDSPPKLPEHIGLPFSLHIAKMEIARVLIISQGAVTKTSHEITEVKGQLSLGRQVHQLHFQQLSWNGIHFQAQGKIQTSPPFITSVTVKADTTNLGLAGLQLPWKKWLGEVSGDFSALSLQLRAQSDTVKRKSVSEIAATTIFHPFRAEWLQPVRLQIRNLAWASLVQDPNSALATWQALLDADIFLSLVKGQPHLDLNIRNKLPGKWTEKKISLQSLQGHIAHLNSKWLISDLRLVDWSGQSVTGSAQWLTAPRQQFHAELHLPGLRVEASWVDQAQGSSGVWNAKLQAKAWNPASLNASLIKQGLSALPAGDVNGFFNLQPGTAGLLFELGLLNSRLAHVPVTGQAKGLIVAPQSPSTAWEFDQIDFLVTLAQVRLQGAGSLGATASKLSLALKASNIEQLAALWGIPAAGSVEMHAVLGGKWNDPLMTGSLTAAQLRWGKDKTSALQLARLNGYVQIVDRQIKADFNADRIRLGNTLLNEAGLEAQGSLEQHVFYMRAQGVGAERPLQASAEFAGSWFGSKQEGVWRGQWRRFDNQGKYHIRLQTPAELEIGSKNLKMKGAVLELLGGQVRIEELAYDAGQWRSRGSLQQLSGLALSRWLPGLATPRNTLTLGGRWDCILGNQLEGEFQLARESGDVWLSRVSNQSLGVERLGVNISLRNNSLDGRFDLFAQRAGQLQARLQTALSSGDQGFGISADAPINASLKGQLSSLAWLGLLTDVPFSAEGNISVEAKASGTFKNPQLEGFLNGDQLVLRSYQPRATLRDGKVRLSLESGVVHLREFSFSGRTGRLNAVGSLDPRLRGEQGKIHINLDKLDALTDPWYRLTTSGELQLSVRDLQSNGAVRVAGKLRADQARLTLKDVTVPSLSEDVIVLNGSNEVPLAQRHFPVDTELEFDFGDDFEVVGYGAEAQLKGSMAFQARTGHPLRASGTVRTSSGRYFAYGQELTIERGAVSFGGTLDNPSLNFYAMRENLPVEVGVEVSGTLNNPRAKLISRPQMSNTEKISWLALGRGIDSASRSDLQLLSFAASALLDRGEGLPLSQRVARNIGLDDIGLRGGAGLEETIVTLGKRLSSRLYLTLERSLGGTSTLAKLRYEVARRWYLQAVAGTESALDMFFTLSFD